MSQCTCGHGFAGHDPTCPVSNDIRERLQKLGALPSPAREAITRDQAFERAAVVKYLRRVAVGQSSDTHRLLFDITYAIEQAEHHEPR